MAVRVRLTRKLANVINGIDLTGLEPGDEFELPRREALVLLAEGRAVPIASPRDVADDRSKPVAPSPGATRRTPPDGRTILVVDDEPTILGLLTRMLRYHGFRVRTAPNATEAIALLDVLPVVAILLDIRMPGRSGLTVLRHVRHQPGLDHVPVLVLTGATLTAEEEATIAAGHACVFCKTDIDEIIGYLEKLTAGQRQQP